MKIFQYLQTKGISRRKCIQLIKDGVIFVNNQKIQSFNFDIKDGDNLEVRALDISGLVAGKINLLESKNIFKNQIIIFNKPKGYVVSKDDKHNKTIYDILPPELKDKYYYIGRLDKDSHGLLLLTDDPKLVNEYEHPKCEITKEYIVQIDKKFSKSDIEKCLVWIIDDGEKLKFQSVKFFQENGKYFLNIILNEGKKRHIRRVLKALGYEVIDLMRIREGEFELGNLKDGEFKFFNG